MKTDARVRYGCGQLISSWVREGMQTPPEEVADRLGKICDAFLRAYVTVQPRTSHYAAKSVRKPEG